jgi:hypothetical protein
VGTLHEDQHTILILSHSVLIRMKNVSDKSCRKYQNTHFTSTNFFFLENRAIYEIKWKNIADPDRPQITTGRMRIACWIPTVNKHALTIYNTVLMWSIPLCFITVIYQQKNQSNTTPILC